jgi:hypothetical protein
LLRSTGGRLGAVDAQVDQALRETVVPPATATPRSASRASHYR